MATYVISGEVLETNTYTVTWTITGAAETPIDEIYCDLKETQVAEILILCDKTYTLSNISLKELDCGEYEATVTYILGSYDKERIEKALNAGGIVMQIAISNVSTTEYYALSSAGASAYFPAQEVGWVEQGFERNYPITTLTVRKRYTSMPPAWVTNAQDKIQNINNAPLFGSPEGSLKLNAVQTGEFVYDDIDSTNYVEATITYDYSKPKSQIALPTLTIPAHEGWQLLNIKRKVGFDAQGKLSVIPYAYNILNVYPKSDISPF